jgi:putative transposase
VLCKIAIMETAKRHDIEILDEEVDINHVHVIASLPLTMTPARAVQLLKGCSARLLFKEVQHLQSIYPRGHLWSPGKFMASVGHITIDKAKAYLEAHHAKATCGIPAPERSEGVARRQSFRTGRTSIFARQRRAYRLECFRRDVCHRYAYET